MDISSSEIFGAISIALGMYGSVIYFISILKRQSRPHFYTFVIWGIITWIGFFAQLSDHAGPGMWATLLTAISTTATALIAIPYGTKDITRSDLIFLLLSLSAIVPWVMTNDPLLSVIMICLIDAIAMIPTIRKSWNDPWGENLKSYGIHNFKFVFAVVALTNFTFVTLAYPIAVILVNCALIGVCLYRRNKIPAPQLPV